MPTDWRGEPGPQHDSETGGGADARVILWSRAGSEPPVDLVASLERRGLRIEWAHDAFGALARLCVAHGRGGGSVRPVALVMNDPGRLDGAAELVEQARTRAPRAIVWVWDPEGSVALRPWRETDGNVAARAPEPEPGAHPQPEIVVKPRPEPVRGGAPELRLAGDGPLQGGFEPEEGGADGGLAANPEPATDEIEAGEGDEPATQSDTGPKRVSLSDEELAMLLGDDTHDDTREDHG